MRCSVLQCVAVCCSALQCIAVRCSALQFVAVRRSALQCVVVRCSAFLDRPCRRLSKTKLEGFENFPQGGSPVIFYSTLSSDFWLLTFDFWECLPVLWPPPCQETVACNDGVAVCCSALQCIAVCYQWVRPPWCEKIVACKDSVVGRCSALQRDAVCCSVVQLLPGFPANSVAYADGVTACVGKQSLVQMALQRVAAWCSVLQCVAVVTRFSGYISVRKKSLVVTSSLTSSFVCSSRSIWLNFSRSQLYCYLIQHIW